MSWFDTAYRDQSLPPHSYPLCATTGLPEDCPPSRSVDVTLPAAWLAVVLVLVAAVIGYRRLLVMLSR